MGRNALKTVQAFFPKVTKVKDARSPLLIEVTKQDAASRGKKNHRTCALAVACKRTTKATGAIIAKSTAYLIKGENAYRYFLSPAASREIVSFDRGGGFEPGKYQLNQVPKDKRIGSRIYKGKEKGAPVKQPKRFQHITTNVRTGLS